MARNAEAAGFNPLTALRNGGAAGFMSTTSPALSTGEVIGNAMGQVGNFLADFDPMADQKREAEYNLVQAQIANLNASTASMFPPRPGKPGSFNVPAYQAGQVKKNPKTAALSAGGPVEMGDRTVTNPWSDGTVNPAYLDAAAYEQRYGDSELVQTGVAIRNGIADFGWNLEQEGEKKAKKFEPFFKAGALSAAEKRKRNAEREARIRRDAARNARDLGFH